MPRSPLDLSDPLAQDLAPQRRPSLTAIVAGTVTALAVQLILALFAAYAGFGRFGGEAIDLAANDIVSGLAAPALMLGIAGLCGGWVAGRLVYLPGGMAGSVHGGVAWALAILVAATAATASLGPLSSGAFSLVSGAGRAFEASAALELPTVTEAVPEVAALREPGEDPMQAGLEEAVRRARDFLSGAPGSDREQMHEALLGSLERLLQAEQPLQGPDAQQAADLIQRLENGTREQAEARLSQWVDAYHKAVADARRQAERNAARTITAALIAAISLTVGGVAAFIGGWLGSPSERPQAPL